MLLGKKPIGTVAYLGGLPAVLEPFCWSWGRMLLHSHEALCEPNQYIHTDRATYSDHGPARNSLVAKFQGDWLLQLDTDHQFDPDLLVRMLHRMDANGFDVMTGFYQFKKAPHAPVLFMRKDDERPVSVICNWSHDDAMIQVSSAGGGCLLVRRCVFTRIFDELKEQPFDRCEGLSEDHSFFWRCKQLGIPVWCDMRIECNHLQVYPVSKSDFDPNEMELSEPIAVAGRKD